jgi:cytochrome P450
LGVIGVCFIGREAPLAVSYFILADEGIYTNSAHYRAGAPLLGWSADLMTKTDYHHGEFSVYRSPLGCQVNTSSVDTAKVLFLKQTQRRYGPLAALLRSAFRHRVMIVADGEAWQRTHAAISPHLHGARVAREYVPLIKSVAAKIFDELAVRSAGAGPVPVPVHIEVESLMRVVTLSVMGYILFGVALSVDEAEYLEKTLSLASQRVRGRVPILINAAVAIVLRALNRSQNQVFVFPREQRQALKDLLRWIGAKVDQARSAAVPIPLLDSLTSRFAHDAPARQKRFIVAEYAMLCVAGIDTTAATLTFAIAEITNNPAVRDAVITEARRGREDAPTSDALTGQYPHIYHVMRETMRRHTIVPNKMREAASDQEIRGKRHGSTDAEETVKVKRGSVLRYVPARGNMQHTIWELPHRFDPNRFARPLTADQKKNYHTFGFGPQSCPGGAMAVTETILILQAFFERLDIEHQEITQSIPVVSNGLTIRPVGVTARVLAAPRAGLDSIAP